MLQINKNFNFTTNANVPFLLKNFKPIGYTNAMFQCMLHSGYRTKKISCTIINICKIATLLYLNIDIGGCFREATAQGSTK